MKLATTGDVNSRTGQRRGSAVLFFVLHILRIVHYGLISNIADMTQRPSRLTASM